MCVCVCVGGGVNMASGWTVYYLHNEFLKLIISQEPWFVLRWRLTVSLQVLHMIHGHLENGELVKFPRDCIASRDHLSKLRHVAIHALPSLLLYLTMLGPPAKCVCGVCVEEGSSVCVCVVCRGGQ